VRYTRRQYRRTFAGSIRRRGMNWGLSPGGLQGAGGRPILVLRNEIHGLGVCFVNEWINWINCINRRKSAMKSSLLRTRLPIGLAVSLFVALGSAWTFGPNGDVPKVGDDAPDF